MPDFDKSSPKRLTGIEQANSGRNNPRFQKPGDIQKDMERADRAEASQALQQIKPARILEPRCNVCKHPYRDFIEAMLIKGHSYKGIAERVQPRVSRESISGHWKNHMDLQDAAMRAILEDEANLQNRNFQDGVQDAITKRGILEIAMRKAFEDIQNGTTTVEARDMIQIAKLLGDMDSNAQSIGLDEARAQVQIFLQAIKDVCDAETQNAISQRVKVLRTRESIDSQMERALGVSDDVIEVEVIE